MGGFCAGSGGPVLRLLGHTRLPETPACLETPATAYRLASDRQDAFAEGREAQGRDADIGTCQHSRPDASQMAMALAGQGDSSPELLPASPCCERPHAGGPASVMSSPELLAMPGCEAHGLTAYKWELPACMDAANQIEDAVKNYLSLPKPHCLATLQSHGSAASTASFVCCDIQVTLLGTPLDPTGAGPILRDWVRTLESSLLPYSRILGSPLAFFVGLGFLLQWTWCLRHVVPPRRVTHRCIPGRYTTRPVHYHRRVSCHTRRRLRLSKSCNDSVHLWLSGPALKSPSRRRYLRSLRITGRTHSCLAPRPGYLLGFLGCYGASSVACVLFVLILSMQRQAEHSSLFTQPYQCVCCSFLSVITFVAHLRQQLYLFLICVPKENMTENISFKTHILFPSIYVFHSI